MAVTPVGSVAVFVRPVAAGFLKDLTKQLEGTGMSAVGRNIAEDIVAPLKQGTSAGAKKAKDGIDDELGKKAASPDIDEKEYEQEGEKSGKKFTGSFQAIALAGIGAAGAAIGATFAAAFTSAIDQNMNAGQLQAALGIDSKSARSLAGDASGMYASGIGTDSASNTDAIALAAQIAPEVDSRSLAESALTLEKTFGYSVEETLKTVDVMLKKGLVGSWEEGFDLITSATQQGANSQGDFLETMWEYSGNFAQLGLTGSEAVGMIVQGLDAGAFNTDKLGDAFKEFSIRAVDGSELTRESLEALGLDANQISSDIAAGGPRAAAAYQQVTDALRGVEDPLKRNQIAVGLFGTQAEDLGDSLYSMDLESASASFGDVAGATEEAKQAQIDAMSPLETFQRGMSGLASELGNLMAPALGAVSGALRDVFTYISEQAIPALQDFGGWVQDNSAWLGPLALGLGIVAGAILAIVAAKLIWTGVTTALAAAQAFLSTTLLANPITWVVIAIVALVAALVLAYQKSETFRNIVNAVWSAIKTAIGAVVTWITDTAVPWLLSAWEAIKNGLVGFYQNYLLPIWNGILGVINAVIGWVVNTAVPWLQSAWTAISNGVSWLYHSIILPIWDAIRIAIAIAVGIIMTIIDGLVWYYRNVVGPVFQWLYRNVVLPVWNAIKAAIGAVVAWFRDTAWPILSLVINWIRTKFEQFKLGLAIIWAYIKNSVINPVIAWFKNVVWPTISNVINWIRTKFEQFKLGLAIIWAYIKNNVIAPVIAWLRDSVLPTIRRVIDLIKDKFENFKNNLKRIWNFVRYDVIQPVVNWLMDSVVGRITDFIDKVKSGFEGLKTGIKEIWNQIKDVIRDPVEWIIETILNKGIIDNINSVLTTFGMEDKHIKPVSLPKGFASGGYTGPGSKYQPAGVVHADEFVIRKESQNSLRRAAPGFLDSLNRYGAKAIDGAGYGYAGGGWVKPFQGSFSQNSGFRTSHRPGHDGVDYPTPTGTPIVAVTDGTVKSARRTLGPAGKKIALSTALTGVVAGYHHLSQMLVDAGDQVTAGQLLGYTGNTGRSSGPHLHFSIKRDGKYVDPNPYLAGSGAAGEGGGGFWNPFEGLWNSLKDRVAEYVGDSVFGQVLTGMPKFVIDKGIEWAKDALTFWDGDHDPEGGAEQWRDLAKSALKREGQYSRGNLDSMIRRINQESSGDPRAINNTDINAKNGDPSKGLMQVIGSTFRAYRDKSLVNDVYDPLANMVASIRYTLAAYGSLQAGWNRKGGYADGGLVTPELHDNGGYLQPGLSVISNKTRAPEYILTERQWQAVYADGDRRGNINITQNIRDTDVTANAIASALTWEMRRKGITRR